MSRTELIRNEILDQCYAYRPGSRDAQRMARLANKEGEIVGATAAEFEIECAYLVGKGLIAEDRDAIAQAHKRYKVTSDGIDHMERQGFSA